ncbi:MAG: hypothetical protein ABW133_22850, partial [Polyangiaceae bacterium]
MTLRFVACSSLLVLLLGACSEDGSEGLTGAGDAGGDNTKSPTEIPTPVGACPDFVNGDVTFNPGTARTATITMNASSSGNGPLIVYWHSTNNDATEALRALNVAAVTAAGGIIVAPHDPNYPGDSFPWLNHFADHDALFDEIFACAVQKKKVHPGRVHALGFSAGGLMTTHLSFARSKYLASIAAYSGGNVEDAPMFQDMNNKFPAMLITGGLAKDTFDTGTMVVNFHTMTQAWQSTLKSAGHFAMLCDHGGGHVLPSNAVKDGIVQFFVDHPYGTNPSPYAGGKIPSAL